MIIAIAVILGIVLLVIFWIIAVYNNLIKLRNLGQNAWSDVDVQLKRRYDLIPNLVNTVKGYAKHEKETFENVTKARSMAQNAKTPGEKGQAENFLTQALGRLFAVVENYPELKANQNFLELQKTLGDIENDIQSARRYYNAVVRDYNIALEVFPNNIVAGMFNFKPLEFFELPNENQREAPEVKF